MDFEFETTRTGLANAFAAAGAELLVYQPLVSAAVAAIPDTKPEKYAIASTLPGILQMAGKMMGEEGKMGIEGLTGEALLREIFTRPDLPEYSRESEIRYVMSEEGEITVTRRDFDAMAEFAKRFVASPQTVSAAEKPTGDLPPLPWGDDFEAWLEPRRQKDVAAAMHDYARAAIALHIASQPTGDLTDESAPCSEGQLAELDEAYESAAGDEE